MNQNCSFVLRPPSLHRGELRLRPDQNHLVHFTAHVRLRPGGRLFPHDQLHHDDPHAAQPRHQIQEEEAVRDMEETAGKTGQTS